MLGEDERMRTMVTVALAGGIGILVAGCVIAPVPHYSKITPAVQGTVVDSESHLPIQGARIQLADRPKVAATSNVQGSFRLPAAKNFFWLWIATYDGISNHLPFGPTPSDTIRISHPDYHSLVFSIETNLHIQGWYRVDLSELYTHQDTTIKLPDISLEPLSK
jgi:hypothetical protein